MKRGTRRVTTRILYTSTILGIVLLAAGLIGISVGPAGGNFRMVFRSVLGQAVLESTISDIIWHIRLPRVLSAALVGATLSLGGLVFQALLRNPLAEPYILGISGGAAVGAIGGILLGLSHFPGISLASFLGGMATVGLLLYLTSGKTILRPDALLLSGVMVNAFCSAVILFLVSIGQRTQVHSIIFWLMGDLSMVDTRQVTFMAVLILPAFGIIFWLSHVMNLLLLGQETARSLGINVKSMTLLLMAATSLMVSIAVSNCGLLGFVGLVIPHLLRLFLGADHRILAPACIMGGGAYMILCDLLARTLPGQGEVPVGVITALIGAPLFIYLLKRAAPK
ncbi:MAG: iron ABC transporter permease [Desulfobacterales bacterium]|nr:iron ABC transporter permease [Desulfobacterales bacterium]